MARTTLLNPIVRCERCGREKSVETFSIGVDETEINGIVVITASIVFYVECECHKIISLKYEANNLAELKKDIYTVASSIDCRTIGKRN